MVQKRTRSARRRRARRRRTRRQKGGNKKVVVFTLTHGAGFGSVFGFLLEAYIYAKTTGYEFRVKNENWQYGPEKGWHDFFTTLEPYNPTEKADEENYRHSKNTSGNYTLRQYNEAIQEVYKPKKEIIDKAEEFKRSIGGPYSSLFIRRGDKTYGAAKEMTPADLPTLVKESGLKDGNIFLMSDDYAVIEEIKKLLPAAKIFTLTDKEDKGFSIITIQNEGAEVRKNEAEKLFTSIEIFHGGEKGWADNRSNLGRFLKLRDLDKVVLYPQVDEIPLEKIIHPSTGELTP
jgi:glycerophosphoryl diester phosphodiesterase